MKLWKLGIKVMTIIYQEEKIWTFQRMNLIGLNLQFKDRQSNLQMKAKSPRNRLKSRKKLC